MISEVPSRGDALFVIISTFGVMYFTGNEMQNGGEVSVLTCCAYSPAVIFNHVGLKKKNKIIIYFMQHGLCVYSLKVILISLLRFVSRFVCCY